MKKDSLRKAKELTKKLEEALDSLEDNQSSESVADLAVYTCDRVTDIVDRLLTNPNFSMYTILDLTEIKHLVGKLNNLALEQTAEITSD